MNPANLVCQDFKELLVKEDHKDYQEKMSVLLHTIRNYVIILVCRVTWLSMIFSELFYYFRVHQEKTVSQGHQEQQVSLGLAVHLAYQASKV